MEQNELIIQERQLEILQKTIDNLITHRETITDNTGVFTVSDMVDLTESIDSHILCCVDAINMIGSTRKSG